MKDLEKKTEHKLSREELLAEIESLRFRAEEAEEVLSSLRRGEIDALVVGERGNEEVYTLQGAEYAYRLMVERMREGAVTLGPDGTILYSNQAFAEIIATPFAEIINSSFATYVSPRNHEAFQAFFEWATRETTGHLEITLETRTSGPIPVYLSASPVQMDESTCVSMVITDLSAHAAAQEAQQLKQQLELTTSELQQQNAILYETNMALEAQRTRYHEMFDFAPDGYMTTDERGVVEEVNQAAADLLRSSREFPIGKLIESFVARGKREEFRHHMARLRQGTGERTWDTLLRPQTGEEPFYAALTVSTVRNQRGNIKGMRWIIRDITERKAAEKRLVEAHAKTVSILESISDVFVTIDREWRFTYVNNAATKLARMTREELVGKIVWELFPYASDLRFGVDMRRAMEESIPTRFEEFYPEPYNRWFDVRCFPSAEGLSVSLSDITERKKSKEALHESQSLLRTIMERTPDPVYIKDLHSHILMGNPALARVIGKPIEEILGKADSEFYSDSALAITIRENDLRVIAHNQNEVMEETVPTPQGWRTFLSSKTPYHSATGEVIGLIGISRDITERKQAEEALRESEERFKLASQAINGLIYDCDVATGHVIRSGGLVELLGYDPADVEPSVQWWYDQMHPEDLPRVKKETNGFLIPNGPDRASREYRVRHRDGHYIHVWDTCVIIRDEEGREIRRVGNTMDITERKQWEDQVQKAAEELKRSNEDLQQFAYIASHDLQEPLRTISNFLQLLRRRYEEKLDEDGRSFITFAVDGAARMSLLLRDLLEYSRAGIRQKPLQSTDLNTTLSSVVDNLNDAIVKSGAEVKYGSLPSVMADPPKLILLLQNLIGNSIKFHGDKVEKPVVEVEAREEHNHVVISVRDNGIGIEPSSGDRVFKVFQRLHSQKEYPGTGIGLAICKKIVERHGGRIWYESELGKGTTFYFTMMKG